MDELLRETLNTKTDRGTDEARHSAVARRFSGQSGKLGVLLDDDRRLPLDDARLALHERFQLREACFERRHASAEITPRDPCRSPVNGYLHEAFGGAGQRCRRWCGPWSRLRLWLRRSRRS